MLDDGTAHLALPALTLGVLIAAGVSRYQRSEMLGILPEDFGPHGDGGRDRR